MTQATNIHRSTGVGSWASSLRRRLLRLLRRYDAIVTWGGLILLLSVRGEYSLLLVSLWIAASLCASIIAFSRR